MSGRHAFRSTVELRNPDQCNNWGQYPYMYYASDGVYFFATLLEEEPTPERRAMLDAEAREAIAASGR